MAICSICGAANPPDETHCAICGARLLAKREAALTDTPADEPGRYYSSAMGEDDLMASRAPGGLVLGLALFLLGMSAAAAIFFGLDRLGGDDPTPTPEPASPVAFATQTPQQVFATPTIGPTLTPSLTRTPPPALPTVTAMIEISPTPDVCTVTVAEGDTLYGLALQCGHRDLAVVNEIVELNSLRCDTCLQIGQTIDIPNPTPTIDPAAGAADPQEQADAGLEVAALSEESGEAMSEERSAEEIIAARQVEFEPTLDPNLMYHTIARDQTLFDLVAIYNVDVKLLSEINPEIEFPQCDFGERFGGPTCAVFFYEGQRIRVPAPTPTPTIEPSPSGSETPTPTATPTINVPVAFGPADGASFDAASIVTLRWTTSGTLGIDEVYAVRVENTEGEEQFTAVTCDLAFDIPPNWQSQEVGFRQFEWTVSVVNIRAGEEDFTVRSDGLTQCGLSFAPTLDWITTINDLPDVGQMQDVALGDPRFQTQPRRFFWQGQG